MMANPPQYQNISSFVCKSGICGKEPFAVLTAIFFAGIGVGIYFVLAKYRQKKFIKRAGGILFLGLILFFWGVFKTIGFLVFGDIPEQIKPKAEIPKKEERTLTGAIAKEVENYRIRQSAAGCPEIPDKYSGLIWVSDKFKREPEQGWFFSLENNKPVMFEGEKDEIIINSTWTDKIYYPSDFVKYYESKLQSGGWMELEKYSDKDLDLFKYVKKGRYFNFGVRKISLNDYYAFTEIAHCYPKNRPKYTLSIELNNPENIEYLYVYTQNLWKSADHDRWGYEANFQTLVKKVMVTGKETIVDLDAGVYKVSGSGRGIYSVNGQDSINLDENKTLKLGVSQILY
jgi:hypothetical protein